MKKRRRILFLAAVAAVVLSALYHGRLEPETYFVSAARLPAAFSGLRITLLTDLHGKEPKGLYEAVAAAKPDLIAISGDLIDERSDPETVYPLLTKLTALAPTYFVTGNHEWVRDDTEDLLKAIEKTGVTVLRNDFLTMEQRRPDPGAGRGRGSQQLRGLGKARRLCRPHPGGRAGGSLHRHALPPE